MTWRFAFGFLPVPVFYVSHLFAGGFSPLVFILILDKYRGDEGLHQHELEHIEQAYRLLLLLHGLLYLLWKPYRQWAEVKAFRRQLDFYGPAASADFAVRLLVQDYWLGISVEEARGRLGEA